MKVTSTVWSCDLVSAGWPALMLMIVASGGLRAQTPPHTSSHGDVTFTKD